MHSILTIDISQTPAKAALYKEEKAELVLIEEYRADEKAFSFPSLPVIDENEDSELQTEPDIISAWSTPFQKLIEKFSNEWDSCVLVIPPHNSLSFSLELPFSTNRQIEQVIDLEIQDRIPMQIEKFSVQFKPAPGEQKLPKRVFASTVPKNYLEQILEICKRSQIDPSVITMPSAFLETLDTASDSNRIILRQTSDFIDMRVVIEGKTAELRSCPVMKEDSGKTLMLHLILATEKKHSITFDKVSTIATTSYQNKIIAENRFEVSELPENIDLNLWAASLVKDSDPVALLINLRSREYKFKPNLKNEPELLKRLKLPALALAVLALFSILSIYSVKEMQISRINQTIDERIRKTIPELNLSHEIATKANENKILEIQNQNSLMSSSLSGLDIITKRSPVTVFKYIIDDFNKADDLTITNVELNASSAILKGMTDKPELPKKLKRTLEKKDKNREKSIYCKIDYVPSRSYSRLSKGDVSFTYTLEFCK